MKKLFNINKIEKLSLDRHVVATLLFRSWSVIAGAVTVLLIPLCLDLVQQGYYYTFSSILALQVFFELGLSQVIIQIIAHEAVYLHQNELGEYDGDPDRVARIAQFQQMLTRWYSAAAALFLLTISVAGLIFFRSGTLSWQQWGLPWLTLVVATTVNLYFSGKLAIIEGFSLVSDISHLRLRQSILGSFVMWFVLFSGGGLWAAVVMPIAAALITFWWLGRHPASNIISIRSSIKPVHLIRWKEDVFPFQWRIAISWVSGYFLFSLFTPAVFSLQGPEEAGRLGFALTIFGAISLIGSSWVYAKAPNLSGLIAKRQSTALIAQFKEVAIRSMSATAVIVCMVLAVAWGALLLDVRLMHRVSSMSVLVCLGFVTIVNSGISAAAVFMRAHKEEPMLVVSIVGGLLTALVVCVSAAHSVAAMMLGYAAVTTFISLPWTLWILKGYFERHAIYWKFFK